MKNKLISGPSICWMDRSYPIYSCGPVALLLDPWIPSRGHPDTLEANKMTLRMIRDAKALGPSNTGSIAHITARGRLVASIYNLQNQRTSYVQTLCEITMNIGDPVTIQSIRTIISLRSLNAYVDRAVK